MDNNQPKEGALAAETKPEHIRPGSVKVAGMDASRRRLAKAGLAVPVIMSLSARPVWASNNGACSLSGDIFSANLSNIDHQCTAGWGCTPGFWKQNIPPWATTPYHPGDCKGSSDNGKCKQFDASTGTRFVDVFGVSPPCGDAVTLMDVLQTCNGESFNLEFHAVAAVLNASSAYVEFGATVEQVVEAYRKAFTNEVEPLTVKSVFENMNERICPLNAHGLCDDGFVNQDDGGHCVPIVTSADKTRSG